jgi:uncharacterized membrane protein
MTYILIITFYFFQAAFDVLDKFLLSARKIRPLSYTFFTVVLGLCMLIAWPWFYESIALKRIFFDLLSGSLFSLALYVFYKAMSEGEVSRVVPFVFGIVPLTDLFISLCFGTNTLLGKEFAALCLLIPGALLISYKKNEFSKKHLSVKVLSAFLWSLYYAFWQFSAQSGDTMNHLMWNRVGAALVLILLLFFPLARKNIFGFRQVKNKKETSVLFVLKQFIGGANFIFFSFLLVIAKISVVNELQDL